MLSPGGTVSPGLEGRLTYLNRTPYGHWPRRPETPKKVPGTIC